MRLQRLIYVSRPQASFRSAQAGEIANLAQARNRLLEVSGILAFRPEWLLQVLEGPKESVTKVFAAIARDPRHYDVQLLAFDRLHERQFGDWSMRYLALTTAHREVLGRHLHGELTDYDSVARASPQRLLRALSAVASPLRSTGARRAAHVADEAHGQFDELRLDEREAAEARVAREYGDRP